MDNISQAEAVNRVQEYIKVNLKNRMTLHEIANYSAIRHGIFQKYLRNSQGNNL